MNISEAIQFLQGNETVKLIASQQGKLGIEGERREIQKALADLFKEAAPEDNDYVEFCKIVNAFMSFEIVSSGMRNIWLFESIPFTER
jgi:hypothetical protein